LLGLITAVSIISLKGGEEMPLTPIASEAGTGLPPSDLYNPGTFETATFALG